MSAPARPMRVRRAVQAAMLHWRAQQKGRPAANLPAPPLEHVLQPLERRAALTDVQPIAALPHDDQRPMTAGLGRSLARLLTWLRLMASVVLGFGWLGLTRRGTPERRAALFRAALERAGGTFVKFGQQAAMRIDLLPWAYCVELSKMLDKMTPFSTKLALQAIERTTGRPWQDTFAVFDPEPIGSASIACVYQATLKDGAKVAVKVRRPDIYNTFLADFQVLDWLAYLAEFLTIFRPGFTRNLRAELRETLMEELDFKREARFQDTFRRNAADSGQDFFTAPKVYFDLSGEEVLVQEFVTGLWLWEVIGAVEAKDPRGRAELLRRGIDPLRTARRIMWTAFWSMDEHLFFHADPHPANILVCEGGRLTFIDFGSCGSFNSHQRAALEQMVLAMDRKDSEGMALANLNLMQPLPPVDLPALMKTLQVEYLRLLSTFDTPAEHTEYWERTSARQWVVLVRVARQFNLPLNLHMLRMIRATLLYDSIVLRLDPQLSRHAEYMKFMKHRARLIKKKWRTRLRDNAGDSFILRVEELGHTLNDLMLRAQTALGRPIVAYGSTVDKWVFAASVLSRLAGRIMLVTAVSVLLASLAGSLSGQPAPVGATLLAVLQNMVYQIFVVFAAAFSLRHIVVRLLDRDSSRAAAG